MQFNFTILVYITFYFIKSQQKSFVHDKKNWKLFLYSQIFLYILLFL